MASLDFGLIRDLLRGQKHKALAKIEPLIIEYYKNEVIQYVVRRPCMEIMVCSVHLNLVYALQQDKNKDPSDPLPDYLMSILQRRMNQDKVILITDYTKLQQNDVVLCLYEGKLNKAIVTKVIDGARVMVKFFQDFFENKLCRLTFDSDSYIIGARNISLTFPSWWRSPNQFFFFFNI